MIAVESNGGSGGGAKRQDPVPNDLLEQRGRARVGGRVIRANHDHMSGEDGQGDTEAGSKQDQGEEAHLAVLVDIVAMEADEGNVGKDDGDQGEDDEEDDGKRQIGEAEVRGGQAIEPSGIEEEEGGNDEANANIAIKAETDILVVGFHHGEDAGNEANQGDDSGGQAEGAEFPRKSNADIRQIDSGAGSRDHIRGDDEAEPNAEKAESCEQQEKDD